MKTLLVLYPGCILFEAALAINLLQRHSAIAVAAPTRELLHSSGLPVQPDLAFHDLVSSDYRCIVVPGGDPGSVIDNPYLKHLFQAAREQGAIIGGICAGVLLIASTGILEGRRVTHSYARRYAPEEKVRCTAPFWEGIRYVDEPVVQDGNVVTALPHAHIDFAMALLQALDLSGPEKAAQMARYFRGEFPADFEFPS